MTSNDNNVDRRKALEEVQNPKTSGVLSDALDEAKETASNAKKFNRRQALKVAGSATATTLSPVGLSKASAKQMDLIGVSYDHYTHQSQTAAKASLERHSGGGMSGTLRVGGFEIPVGTKSDPLDPDGSNIPHNKYSFELDAPAFSQDGLPLQVRFIDFQTDLAGALTRPDMDYGHLAFTMGERDEGYSPEVVRKGLFGGGDGVENRPEKDIPSSGIPAAHVPTVPGEGGK